MLLLNELGIRDEQNETKADYKKYETELSEMIGYLSYITDWEPTIKPDEMTVCVCEAKAVSPSAVQICLVLSGKKQDRDFDRVRTQYIWQIEMVYEQPLLCFDVKTKKFVTVNVLNGFRTHSDYKFVAISHLWPRPMDVDQQRGDSQLASPLILSSSHYKYNRNEVHFDDISDDNWVHKKFSAVVTAIMTLYSGEPGSKFARDSQVLVWLDVVSVNQGDPFAVRDATYAMSIAYHISDLTLVLLDPNDDDARRWLKRRWTLQELELAHDIILMTSDFKELTTLPIEVIAAREHRGKHDLCSALQQSVNRESKYPQDIIYAVRGLVPPLFALPVVYDIDVYTLILRAATVCAKKGDYSLLGAGASGLPAGSLILPFWKEEFQSKTRPEGRSIQVAPLANLTGCGLIYERQKTAQLTAAAIEELTKDRQKRADEFTEKLEDDGGVKAAKSIEKFEVWIRADFGACNISLACRDALANVAKGICDVFKYEHCESFDKNVAEVCESMFGTDTTYTTSKKLLQELLDLLVHADPKHPCAVVHRRSQYVTWVLKSDVTKYEFVEKGILFVKSLFDTRKPPSKEFVLVMRGEKNDAALKFVSFPDKEEIDGWMVLSESVGVSYADSAAIVEYEEQIKKVRVRTQRGVAEMIHANTCTQVDPEGSRYDVFGLNIKRLLELLVDEGAGQKAPVVLA
ncbi:UNVERIFIED_CONTAM: hypothetical protein HDU68_007915 [Siphonaria sp. JEL0065]|nr:hypothetical protein HDU68_007915 [Siphonaria sp. JEL0065]